MSVFLSDEDLVVLTGRQQRAKQIEVIKSLGLRQGLKEDFIVCPTNGRPLVFARGLGRPAEHGMEQDSDG